MRQIREILRLFHAQHASLRTISQQLAISHVAVKKVIDRARAAGYTWPLAEACTDAVLEHALYPHPQGRPLKRPEPDWPAVHRDLRRKGVTLWLLWMEYKTHYPDGYQYTQFCAHYDRWAQQLDVVMRQTHRPGDKMFVDYAGVTVPITDAHTGTVWPAQVFVATLGASQYTFTEVQPNPGLNAWIQGHVHAVEHFQGVPQAVVPDNLRSGVTTPDRYEPLIQVTYHEWATHYQTTILPARVRKPRDKALVETPVKIVEQQILAPLRHHTFFSLAEANAAVTPRLTALNQRAFQKLPGTRQERWETEERAALQPLPAHRYEFAEWRHARVHIDYHVAVAEGFYSVPYPLVQAIVDVRLTATTVEIFRETERVASHRRAVKPGTWVTDPHHRPPPHQVLGDWTPDRFQHWAAHIGPATATVINHILAQHAYPEEGYRSCLGILQSLAKRYGEGPLETAATRAVEAQVFSYRGMKNLCEKAAKKTAPAPVGADSPGAANVRGSTYFEQPGQALPVDADDRPTASPAAVAAGTAAPGPE